ncbi:very short patch repair endonuclease [Flavobacterium tructae]|uniref:very short patch repair endonuclease n=1 Tax=Flavobacterium tructae TaxID=1114873 RepID=UPI001F1A2FFF|nr:very short patch repair endonuclease [Flavobacterium tructae]
MFKKIKLVIFVDGEFFHGKNWDIDRNRIKTNSEFWIKKIERNIQRDVEVNMHLEAQNWKVLRFLE